MRDAVGNTNAYRFESARRAALTRWLHICGITHRTRVPTTHHSLDQPPRAEHPDGVQHANEGLQSTMTKLSVP